MTRVLATAVALPFLLALALAGATQLQGGKLGTVTAETFELGLLPIVLLAFVVGLALFVPLLVLTSRFRSVSLWNCVAIGFVSALLPVLFSNWSTLANSRLRLGFRIEQLMDSYPWLILGSLGGLLFWLLALRGNHALVLNLKSTPREA
jgi:hypothetical protein